MGKYHYNCFIVLCFSTVNELEVEGRLAIESPTTPITVTPDTFDLGWWYNAVFYPTSCT